MRLTWRARAFRQYTRALPGDCSDALSALTAGDQFHLTTRALPGECSDMKTP